MYLDLSPAESEIIYRLLLSATLGLVIGIERQLHSKPAGMRTLAVVAVGATLFTIVSLSFTTDPGKLAGAIVTGIGFLGAGAIFREKNRVVGMTTAAELWIVAAIGVAVGIGMYITATIATIVILLVVIGGRSFEDKTEKFFSHHRKKYGEKE